MTMRAIYEDGVFKPAEPVDLPDKAIVELEATLVDPPRPEAKDAQEDIFEILSHRYNTGQTDAAERHNEHQP